MRGSTSFSRVFPLVLALATLFGGSARGDSPLFSRGNAYIREIPAETAAARAARHERIRQRRSRPVIICHRGASAFAPENTLEAYAAAMDYGADGCEMDLRRTRDGVIILFHDDMLDRLTSFFGTVPDYTYEQLLWARPALRYGTATAQTGRPTFAAVLELARQRGMLLHLDVKEPGLDAQIAKMLTEADTWDHVVGVNNVNAPELGRDPRLKLVHYKGPGLFETRLDVDPAAVREQLARPGDGIMVDDPRVAVRELARKPYEPTPLPDFAIPAPKRTMAGYRDTENMPLDFLYAYIRAGIDGHPLGPGLDEAPADASGVEFGSDEYWRQDRKWIMRRAGAAREAGVSGKKSNSLVRKLTHQVEHRMLHKDWMYHGLDGAMAAQALGRLHASEAAPAMVAFFKGVDPELRKVVDPRWPTNPLGWTDFRVKMYILPALGEMPCEVSKRFLTEYVNLDDAVAREMAPLQFAEATQALLKQELSRSELEALLKSRHPEVRGTAILECRDHPTRARTAALKAAAPWALELPAARR